jgi:hypothetical protein
VSDGPGGAPPSSCTNKAKLARIKTPPFDRKAYGRRNAVDTAEPVSEATARVRKLRGDGHIVVVEKVQVGARAVGRGHRVQKEEWRGAIWRVDAR